MAIIDIKNLTFGYDGADYNIFENLNLQLDSKWKLGLIGRNGVGKSTFFQILIGGLEYKGRITTNLTFEKFPYNIENANKTVEEIAFQIDSNAQEWKIICELNKLELFDYVMDREFCTLSMGEQTKVLLAILFAKDSSFLLLDEPTSHLDIRGREVLSRYLNLKESYIIISHDRAFLDGCVDHIMSIENTKIEVTKGNYSVYKENKNYNDAQNQARNEKLKKEIDKYTQASKRTASWAEKAEKEKFSGKQASGLRPDRGHLGAKSAKIMKRAIAFQDRVEKNIVAKENLLKDVDRADNLKISVKNFFSESLMFIDSLCIVFNKKNINQPITFEVFKGDRICLYGKNGAGKSSILKAICGENKNYNGKIEMKNGLIISYLAQDFAELRGTPDAYIQKWGVEKSKFMAILYKLNVDYNQLSGDLSDLSDGQKKKVAISRSLSQEAHIFIWDEPLNFLDVVSREQVERLIVENHPTMIFVEHDKIFCDKIKNKEVKL